MMYVLQNNVEVVAGAKHFCIYDLNQSKLYSIDEDGKHMLDEILANHELPHDMHSRQFVQYLVEAGLIVHKENLLPKRFNETVKFYAEFVWIEITQNCNLTCRHCYEGSSREKKLPEMSFEKFIEIIDQLQILGVKRIQLVGGEPFVHPDIVRMLDYVNGKFEQIEIFTNGTLITDSLFDQIVAAGINLAFSIYSNIEKQHDYVTCTAGSFNKTMTAIQHAKERGIPIRIASIEMRNVPQFVLPGLDEYRRTDLPRLTGRATLNLYNRDMLMRKIITKDTFKMPLNANLFYNNHFLHNCFGYKMYIGCDLKVYPCAMERRVCYGQFDFQILDRVEKQTFPSMTKDKIEGCKQCEYRYACYDCRCDANGATIDKKPWYCSYLPEQGIWRDKEEFVQELLRQIEK